MNKKLIYFFLSFLFSLNLWAQKEKDSLFFKIHFKWKTETLDLNKNYISKSDTLQLNVLKFYISGIEIKYNDGTFYREKNSYHLVDIENFKPFTISKFENKTIENIVFNIGVDSTACVSGANGGDLDLQNGMYWAWQSGYINMKIEGKSNSCKTRKNQFQFHIGGYIEPNYARRTININGNFNDKNQIDLVMDLSKLFEEINLSEINSIMIPGEKAMHLADVTTKIFSIE